MRIAVVSSAGTPLSPTTPSKARKLLKTGGALPKRNPLGIFYLQLTTTTRDEIPHDTVVGIDPGKLYSGVGVQTPQATLWMGHLVLPFPVVKQAMKTRRDLRRFRRYRKTPQRPMRFLHRTGHKIPPSIKANRELEWRVLQELRKIYPITVRFGIRENHQKERTIARQSCRGWRGTRRWALSALCAFSRQKWRVWSAVDGNLCRDRSPVCGYPAPPVVSPSVTCPKSGQRGDP